jgi:hypothetical protein
MKARRESFRKWIVLQNYSPPTLEKSSWEHHNLKNYFVLENIFLYLSKLQGPTSHANS